MFTPHTKHDVEVMLKSIGVEKIEDLFQEIPEEFRYPDLDLAPRLTEMEVAAELENIASANGTTRDFLSFLGAGAYDHYIPAAVDNLLQRGEFYTAYTPYQPEISQGTLRLFLNSEPDLPSDRHGRQATPHYDGAQLPPKRLSSRLVISAKTEVLVSRAVNPQYRQRSGLYANGRISQILG